MGQMVAGQVEAGQVHAVPVALQRREDPRRNALGGLALVIAGEHPVDVGVVGGPEPAPHIHRELVGAGNDQDSAVGGKLACRLGGFQGADQLAADVHLLDFIAPQRAHHRQAFLAGIAEPPGPHLQRRTVGGVDGKQDFLFHCTAAPFPFSSRIRAIREPS